MEIATNLTLKTFTLANVCTDFKENTAKKEFPTAILGLVKMVGYAQIT